MDNLNDWLYIVLLAIAGISSLFSSKKKKNRPTEILGQPDKDIVVQQEEVPQKGFWEILEEMQQEKPQPASPRPVATSTKKQKKQKAAEPTPFLTGERFTSGGPGQLSAISATEVPIEESASPEFELDTPIDLRKAVIYAEILNRKY